jgi:hypothetical protein
MATATGDGADAMPSGHDRCRGGCSVHTQLECVCQFLEGRVGQRDGVAYLFGQVRAFADCPTFVLAEAGEVAQAAVQRIAPGRPVRRRPMRRWPG